MKKILVITEHYPSEENIYNYMFVHARVLEYIKRGADVLVFYASQDNEKYEYEGVQVLKGSFDNYRNTIKQFSPDVTFLHSPKELLIKSYMDIKETVGTPTFTWIHGVEALSVYRRIFNATNTREKLKLIIKGLYIETKRKMLFRRYFSMLRKHQDSFVFVSNWMKDVTEKDNFLNIKDYKIIPNFIDTQNFSCEKKRNNKSLLIVRSFGSRKYANDISIDIINSLYKIRNDFNVTIYGDGIHYDKEISRLKIPSTMLKTEKRMLSREELSTTLNDPEYGFFLCPTRQDAQGVTMCEAMASGLIAVTNPNTAIPEFVKPSYAILSEKVNDIVFSISKLMDDREYYNEVSEKSIRYISENLSEDILINKELELSK